MLFILEEVFEFLILVIIGIVGISYSFILLRDLIRHKWWKKWKFWLLIVLYVLFGFVTQVALFGFAFGHNNFWDYILIYILTIGVPLTIPTFHFIFLKKQKIFKNKYLIRFNKK